MSARFNIGDTTRICDFGCGPGLYTTLFAEKGANVTGIDFSRRSIEYAKNTAVEKNLEIDYILEDYLKLTTDKKFDLITFIYYDLCPLNPEQRKIIFKKFYEYLEADGKIILDVLSLKHYNKANEKSTYEYSEQDGFWAANPYYVFSNTFKYDDEKVLLDKYVLFEKDRTRKIYNWLQCYSFESLKKELKENGFRVVEHYSDVSGAHYQPDSTEIAVVIEKM